MKHILIILLFVSALRLTAQTEFSNYSWNTFPPKHQTDTIKSQDGTVILLERRITEIYLNSENFFEELFVLHKKVKVETNQAVDEQNKIYIPVQDVIDIVNIQARFISATGKITNLPKESIKEVENLENQGNYKTFAVEGVETGGQIEYFYTLKRKFSAYKSVFVQEEVPKGDVFVLLAFPSKLSYLIKSYNGFPDFVLNTENDEKSYLKAEAGYVPGLRKELYAYYQANKMRYEYTLAFNFFNASRRIYSWAKLSNNIYSNIIPLEKKEAKAIESFVKKLNIPAGDLTSKIRYIENRLKSEISVSEEIQQTMSLDDIIKYEQADKNGMLKLFLAVFNAAGIQSEVVGTSDMESKPFDPDFNGYNFVDDFLLYLPQIDNYVVPYDGTFRMGILPSIYQGGYGLFMSEVANTDDLKTFGYEIRQLPMANHVENTDTMVQQISLNLDEAQLKVKSYRAMYGDAGRIFQSFWVLNDKERKDELVKLVFNMGSENTVIDAYTVKNELPEDIGVKPITWNLDITVNALVENAGDDIIVKLGETIGTQSELYQATTRKMPVNIDVLHNYYRKLVFTIPDGYTVSNPENMNLNVEMLNNGKISCKFNSVATLTGNKLVIISTEYYSESSYPVSRYEEFRKVINAAADFNKKTILLKKVK